VRPPAAGSGSVSASRTAGDAQFDLAPPPEDGGEQPGLELHHSHIEFSLQNGVSLKALEKDYPGVSNPNEIARGWRAGTTSGGSAPGTIAALQGHMQRAIATGPPAPTSRA
jgi:hypothetical protein